MRNAFRTLLLVCLFSTSACSLTDPTSTPENVELVLSGSSGGQVRLVTSQVFTLGGGGEGDSGTVVELIAADTSIVSSRHQAIFPLAPSYIFYAQTLPLSPDVAPQELQMSVFVDGQTRYSKSGSLGLDDFEYAYVYR